jgi:hypothetical protein
MEDLLWCVGMVSTLFIQLLRGETDPSDLPLSLCGHQMENMQFGKAPPRLKFSVKHFRFGFFGNLYVMNHISVLNFLVPFSFLFKHVTSHPTLQPIKQE